MLLTHQRPKVSAALKSSQSALSAARASKSPRDLPHTTATLPKNLGVALRDAM
jgi:hypothetical protein